jgi:hypothetical protein
VASKVGSMIDQHWASVLAAAASPSVSDTGDLLRTAVRLGLDIAPGTAGCSITERTGSGYRTTASASELAVALDRWQYDAGTGPCLSAASGGAVERLDDMVRETRFPAFRTAAAEAGVRSSLSVGLTGLDRPAALNLYAATPAAYAAERPRAVADLLARCVTALLPGGRPPQDSAGLAAARARGDRISRALAVLMATRRLDRAAAFAELTRQSQRQGRSVSELAEDLLLRAGRQNAP